MLNQQFSHTVVSQLVALPTDQPISQSINLSVCLSVSQSIIQSVSQPISQSVCLSVSHSIATLPQAKARSLQYRAHLNVRINRVLDPQNQDITQDFPSFRDENKRMSKETVNQENEAPKIIMIIIIEIFKSENKKNLEGNINNSDINYVIINKSNDNHITNYDNTN